jgi:hypothetical protein
MGRVVLKLNNLAIRIVVVLGKSLVEGTGDWAIGPVFMGSDMENGDSPRQ